MGRAALSWNQLTLSEKAGVSRFCIFELETGLVRDDAKLRRVLDALEGQHQVKADDASTFAEDLAPNKSDALALFERLRNNPDAIAALRLVSTGAQSAHQILSLIAG